MILTFSCYFSVVSVILWTTAQTPMQCDRIVLLRFPNQVSSPPLLLPSYPPFFLASQRTSVLAETSVLRPYLCWIWANSLLCLPSFPLWDGCCKAAKYRGSYYLVSKKDFQSLVSFINFSRWKRMLKMDILNTILIHSRHFDWLLV